MVSYQGRQAGIGSQKACGLERIIQELGAGSSVCVRWFALFDLPPSNPTYSPHRRSCGSVTTINS